MPVPKKIPFAGAEPTDAAREQRKLFAKFKTVAAVERMLAATMPLRRAVLFAEQLRFRLRRRYEQHLAKHISEAGYE